MPDERLSDAAIVSLLREGGRDNAFERLVERFQRKVFHLALGYLRRPDDAEDLAQEAFVRVWRALPSYDGRASLSTWIYVIARNACLTALRKRRLHATSPLDDAEEAASPGPGTKASAFDARLDCDAMLRRLPEPQRRVVALFYLEERSYEQVAEILDMPVNTVRSHLHRARKRLAHSCGGK